MGFAAFFFLFCKKKKQQIFNYIPKENTAMKIYYYAILSIEIVFSILNWPADIHQRKLYIKKYRNLCDQ